MITLSFIISFVIITLELLLLLRLQVASRRPTPTTNPLFGKYILVTDYIDITKRRHQCYTKFGATFRATHGFPATVYTVKEFLELKETYYRFRERLLATSEGVLETEHDWDYKINPFFWDAVAISAEFHSRGALADAQKIKCNLCKMSMTDVYTSEEEIQCPPVVKVIRNPLEVSR